MHRLSLVLAIGVLMVGCNSPAPEAQIASHTRSPGQAESPGQVAPIPWPALSDLISAHVKYGMPVAPDEVPQTLYATHPRQQVRLALLLDRLAGSEISSGDLSPPSRDAILHLALRNGQTLSVRQAYNCSTSPNDTAPVQICKGAPGEIIIQMGSDRARRLRNPAMSEYLSDGWRDDFPSGPAQPMDRETALEIALQRDLHAGWKATFQEEYPVETKEETTVRPVWVVEAESPAGSKTRLVIDALTGEVLLQGHLEALP